MVTVGIHCRTVGVLSETVGVLSEYCRNTVGVLSETAVPIGLSVSRVGPCSMAQANSIYLS